MPLPTPPTLPTLPLSAVFITRNSAEALGPALDSVAFASEILVVDSGSSDGTVALARAHGAKVIEHPWLGFGAQKNFAVRQAAHDWVLCIDSDERVSPALAAAIRQALTHPATAHGYQFRRCNFFLGRWLRHGEGYPDWSLRLFHRDLGNWSDDEVHEKVLLGEPALRLAGDLLHESADGLGRYLEKQNRYSTLAAQTAWQNGQRAHLWQLILSPLWRFVRMYVLRLGFLDGRAGLVHIIIGCGNTFHKYAKLMELQRRSS